MHIPAFGSRGRSGRQEEDQSLPDRLLSLRGPSVHIDIAEVQTTEGRLYLFVATDRTRKFAFAEIHRKALRRTAGDFLRRLAEAMPYKISIMLTDNRTDLTTPGAGGSAAHLIADALAKGEPVRAHTFDYD